MNNEAEALLMETFSDPYEEIENEAGGTTVIIGSRSGEPTTNPRAILYIDEPTRSIQYEGELILGVVGDRFAERIYFNCPRCVHKDNHTIDLSLATTKIYINYKNANKEPYIEECYKEGMLTDDTFMFSWLISDYATVKNGKVEFNVCVKDESSTLTDYAGRVLIPEWHTTIYEGTILPAVDVTDTTPEVLTSDTITSAEIIEAMNDYKNEVAAFEQLLADTESYINERIENNIMSTVNSLENDIAGLSEDIVGLSGDIATTDNSIGVRYLGTFTSNYFDTSNDYLDLETTPGMYTFNIDKGNGSNTTHILVVDKNIQGAIFQTVLSDVTSENRYVSSRHKNPNSSTWTGNETSRQLAYRDELGAKHLGTFTTNPFDESDDYLAPITTSGIYTFIKYTYTGNIKIPYVLIVAENGSTIYQTVFKNLHAGDIIYSRRYLNRAVSDTAWTVLADETVASTIHVANNYVKKDSLYLHNIYIHLKGGVEIDVYLQVLSNKSTAYNFNGTDQNSLLVYLMNNGHVNLGSAYPVTGCYGSGLSLSGMYASGTAFHVIYSDMSTTGGCTASTAWYTSNATVFNDRVVKIV